MKNCIMFSYAFDDKGKPKKLSNDKVAKELEDKGLSWVHLDANSDNTKRWLEREVSYLDHLIIDALTAEETRPRIIEFEKGMLIILRGVGLSENNEAEELVSLRMWIDPERIITVQRRDMKALFDMQASMEAGKVIKNSAEFLYNFIYQIFYTTSPYVYSLTERLDEIENKVITTHNIKLREEILQARSQSAVFKRYLLPQKEVIYKLRNSDQAWLGAWAKRHFQENLDQINHIIEAADEVRDRSQILHDELANAMTEKLNRNMYKVSIITSIFMPLTFITGLFGMNIGGVPGIGNPAAFDICTFAMLFITFLHIVFLKKKDWF